jgi:hypothetical protein
MSGGRLAFFFLLSVLLLPACTQRHGESGVAACPLLVSTLASYGAIVTPGGRYPTGACVELFDPTGTRVVRGYAGAEGMFAFQFVVAGDASGQPFLLRVTHERSGFVAEEQLFFDTSTRADIAYEPGTTPLIAVGDDTLRFTGWLETVPPPVPIRRAYFVNWTRGTVETVSPPPSLDVPFTHEGFGRRGDCAAIVSRHEDGVSGGCWWPRGGGGCAPFCTEAEYRAGLCPLSGVPCAGRRGCEIIDVDERRSDGEPERDRAIVVEPPPPDPPDAGPRDAGPRPDEGVE